MRGSGNTIRRVRGFAPLISIAVIMLLPLWLKYDSIASEVYQVREAEIVAAVNAAPYRIGRWIGVDVPLHEVAGQHLRPTAVLSRRYVHMDSGHVVEVTIIHSGDARDMLGHHPPVCYPSNGWTAVTKSSSSASFGVAVNSGATSGGGEEHDIAKLDIAGLQFPAQRYEFFRSADAAGRLHIRIFNFFVLPDGLVTPDIRDVHRRTSWMRAASPGVAQVQVLTHMEFQEHAAHAAAGEILGGVQEVFQAVGVDFDVTSQ